MVTTLSLRQRAVVRFFDFSLEGRGTGQLGIGNGLRAMCANPFSSRLKRQQVW